MVQSQDLVKISTCACGTEIDVSYQRKTDRVIYDICDRNGRILSSAEMVSNTTKIQIGHLANQKYILMIVDGYDVNCRKFSVQN